MQGGELVLSIGTLWTFVHGALCRRYKRVQGNTEGYACIVVTVSAREVAVGIHERAGGGLAVLLDARTRESMVHTAPTVGVGGGYLVTRAGVRVCCGCCGCMVPPRRSQCEEQ
eukprot:jgi/Ulvmu1/2828/UM142_0026.1